MVQERANAVTLKGNGLTLVGAPIRPGQKAPDFTVLSQDLNPITLASTAGKTRILLSMPSIDTPVCDEEGKTFNKRASEVPNTEILVVTVDLPFAQKRWCGTEGIKNLKTGSDHRDASFGTAYGVLIKELRLLARAAFVVNAAGEVTYAEIVPDVASQPNFNAVIQAAKEAQAVRA